jgi:beta-glucosidase
MIHLKRTVLAAALCLLFISAALVPTQAQNSNAPQLGKSSIKNVIAAMTLEEKAALIVGVSARMSGPPTAAGAATPAPPAAPQSKPLVQGAAGTSFTLQRLGITPMVLADGPAGLRISPTRENEKTTYYCTAFPMATLMASTWNIDLVAKVGQAVGDEVHEYGVDIILGPAMNNHRNPLCGRNFEYYSEDPFVTGKIAAAMVNGIQSRGVGTSIKHFAANNAETNRASLDTIVSERALREIYLEGFRIAVEEAQPWTVMSSYNMINGVYTSESADLLTKILRNDWGFKGFVMTDWGGGKDPIAQMIAGNDMLMPGNANQVQAIIKGVREGKLDVKALDRNVEKILNILVRSPRFKAYAYSNQPDLKAHAQVAREAATEGMILLKNADAALPLAKETKKIAAFGNAAYETVTGGTGSGDVNKAYRVSIAEGLQAAGFAVHEGLQGLYAAYLKTMREVRPQAQRGFMGGSRPTAEMVLNSELIENLAAVADAAVVTIGRISGEGRDRTNAEGDFKLTAVERELIQRVSTAFQAKGKKTVVVLNVGGVVEVASWRDQPDAILLSWLAGQEIGNAVADILGGKVNPSGKLATTIPMSYDDVPSAKSFPGKEVLADPAASAVPAAAPPQAQGLGQGPGPGQGQRGGGPARSRPAAVTYEDGIYVGYRFYESFGVKPAYEFGYGLSYTNFAYGNLKLSSPTFKGKMTASVDIKNGGTVPGKEIVELYLAAPAVKLDKPALELKGFAKTKLLQPGEAQTLMFVLDGRSLASFDGARSAWMAEAGAYEVRIGASSRDIRQKASFTLGRELTVKKESVALVPKVKIAEMKPGRPGHAA